jgi:hypothetical protein
MPKAQGKENDWSLPECMFYFFANLTLHWIRCAQNRVRKKARYQELLDYEQKVKEMETAQELTLKRVQTIKNFVAIREGMLHQLDNQNAAVALSSTTKSDRTSDSGDEQTKESEASTTEEKSLLGEVVENMENFIFRVGGLPLNDESTELNEVSVTYCFLEGHLPWVQNRVSNPMLVYFCLF